MRNADSRRQPVPETGGDREALKAEADIAEKG